MHIYPFFRKGSNRLSFRVLGGCFPWQRLTDICEPTLLGDAIALYGLRSQMRSFLAFVTTHSAGYVLIAIKVNTPVPSTTFNINIKFVLPSEGGGLQAKLTSFHSEKRSERKLDRLAC